jgi:hypothetical protein
MSPKEKEMREEHPKDEEPMVNAPQDESNVSKEIHHDTESQQQQKSTQQTKTMRKKSRLSSMMFLSANLYPEETNREGEEYPSSFCRRLGTTLVNVYNQYEFLIWIVIAICLARAYPPLGAEYLQPQITSTWIAVIFIFREYRITLSNNGITGFTAKQLLTDNLSLSQRLFIIYFTSLPQSLPDSV